MIAVDVDRFIEEHRKLWKCANRKEFALTMSTHCWEESIKDMFAQLMGVQLKIVYFSSNYIIFEYQVHKWNGIMPFFSLSLSISNFVVLFIVYYKFLWFSGLRRILKQQNKLFNLLRSVFFSLHHRQDDIILIIRYCIYIYVVTFNETYFVMPPSNSCQFSQPDLSQISAR